MCHRFKHKCKLFNTGYYREILYIFFYSYSYIQVLILFQLGRDNFYHRDSISSDKA